MIEGYVIYVIDCETTSLDTLNGDVVEISAARLIPRDNGSYEEEQRTWLLKALNPKAITDEALKINGHVREDILCLTKEGKEKYKHPLDVVNDIELWMMDDNVSSMDRIFAGQNPFFDIEALKHLWKKVGKNDFPFAIENNNRVIDTKQMVVLFDVCTGKRRKYYNLSNLVKACGVKKGKAHRADEDVRMTKDLLLKLISFIKEPVAEAFKDCYQSDE